jgi:hypothetical protein
MNEPLPVGLRALLAVLAFAAAAPVFAQVYRWVDARGTVHYANVAPPEGVKAKIVDIDAKAGPPGADSQECYTVRCQGERLEQRLARREALEAERAAARATAAPKPPKGLDFRVYVSLQRGMNEGELLAVAGAPDLMVDQGIALAAPATVQTERHLSSPARAGLRLKNYIWLPTAADPFTTTVTLVGGRITEIERERKF